jgi:uncharacterized cupin superfamily protein
MRRVTVSAIVQVPEAFSILDKLLPGRNYFIAVWPGNWHFYSIESAGSADLCGALRLPFSGMSRDLTSMRPSTTTMNSSAPRSSTVPAASTKVAATLVGPTPNCRNHSDFRSANGEFVCGVWDSTPYHRSPMVFRHYELMHLLEGAVTLEDVAGHTNTFSKGDILLMVLGSTCSWRSECHVTKVYATFRPAS